MTKENLFNSIRGKLIVSCQALPDEPLHSSFIMGRMALAALQGGASGIRANTPEDVAEIKRVVDLPVIGLYKKDYPDCEVYITPTMDEISAMVLCGSDIVAMDATDRLHPGSKTLDEFSLRQGKSTPISFSWPTALPMRSVSMHRKSASISWVPRCVATQVTQRIVPFRISIFSAA